MSTYSEQYDLMHSILADILGDTVAVYSTDITDITAGKVSIFFDPPTVSFPTWYESDFEWKITLVSGYAWNQAQQLEKLFTLIDALQESRKLNISTAEPTTITTGSGKLAAYTLTITM